jgi:hypothetical protein
LTWNEIYDFSSSPPPPIFSAWDMLKNSSERASFQESHFVKKIQTRQISTDA